MCTSVVGYPWGLQFKKNKIFLVFGCDYIYPTISPILIRIAWCQVAKSSSKWSSYSSLFGEECKWEISEADFRHVNIWWFFIWLTGGTFAKDLEKLTNELTAICSNFKQFDMTFIIYWCLTQAFICGFVCHLFVECMIFVNVIFVALKIEFKSVIRIGFLRLQ